MRARTLLFFLATLGLAVLVAVSLAGRTASETVAVASNGSTSPRAVTATATSTPIPPPTIGSVTPNRGPSRGDTIITISGGNFDSNVEVTIDGVALKPLLPVKESDPPPPIRFDENTIKGRTPALVSDPPPTGDVPVDVVVANPDDGTSATDVFTYTPPPTVTGVSPDHGSPLGGTEVTITGTNFLGAAQVVFGDCVDGREPRCLAVSYTTTVVDANTIRTITPAHVHGTVDVLVVNPDEQESDPAGADNDFEYDTLPAPTLDPTTPIDPASGPSVGGTEVTIAGTNFAEGAVVTFGGSGDPDRSEVSAAVASGGTTIIVMTPPHPAGTVDVVVTNPDGLTVTTTFTYDPSPVPTLASTDPIQPASGPSLGGTMVTLTGENFAEGATVTFGGSGDPNRSEVSAAVANEGTTIIVMTPPHPAVTVDVVVTNPDGQSVTETGGFTFDLSPAPTITSIDPAEGPSLGGTPVTITGENFAYGAVVKFGDDRLVPLALEPEDDPTTTIKGLAPHLVRDPLPAGPEEVDVVVTNRDGQSDTLPNGFTYDPIWPAPTITSISPAAGPSVGGTEVTIAGADFAEGATVFFGSCHDTDGDKQERPCGTAAPEDETTVDPTGTTITTVTPGGLYTSVNVTVMNPDQQFAVLQGEFLYTLGPAPTLDGTTPIIPASGQTGGGTAVTIKGGNFADGAIVMIGDQPLVPLDPPNPGDPPLPTFVDENTLQGKTLPGAAGTAVDVAVINPDAQTAIRPDAFYYCGDETPPTTVATASPPEPASGWYNSDVSLSLTATDPPGGEPPPCDSGVKQITHWIGDPPGDPDYNPTVVPGDTAVVAITDEGMTAVGFFAEDMIGNIEDPPNTVEVHIDKTAPTITATAITTRDGQPYTPGTHTNQEVEVTFTCSDDLSGVASIEATGAASGILTDGGLGQRELSVTVTSEGDNQRVDGTCTDVAGNSASTDFDDINIQFQDPALNASASAGGQPYVSGTWTNQNVTVTFTCEPIPGGTAIMSLVPPFVNVETEVFDHRVTSTCTDYEYNASVLTYPEPPGPAIRIDKTRPEAGASAATADGAPYEDKTGVWTNQNVTVTFECEDPPGSLVQGSGVASVAPPVTVSEEGSTPSLVGGCTDNAGNNADPPAYFGPINIDKTEPSCSVFVNPNPLSPANNHLVDVSTTVTVSDGLSGPEGFTLVSVESNEPSSTADDVQGFEPGTDDTTGQLRATRGRVYTLTYEGMDTAGNTTTCARTVTVGAGSPTSTPTVMPTATPPACIDRDGDTDCRDATNDPDDDGCTDAQEAVLGTDPDVWYDVFDVPAPASADPTLNGPRSREVSMGDVLSVLFYAFADAGGPPNGNGVSYDSTKGMSSPYIDPPQNLVVGMMYDRSPGDPDPDGAGPFIDPAGPPNGVIDMGDVLIILAHAFAVDCSGP